MHPRVRNKGLKVAVKALTPLTCLATVAGTSSAFSSVVVCLSVFATQWRVHAVARSDAHRATAQK